MHVASLNDFFPLEFVISFIDLELIKLLLFMNGAQLLLGVKKPPRAFDAAAGN